MNMADMKTDATPLLVESAVVPKISLNPTASGLLTFGVLAMSFYSFSHSLIRLCLFSDEIIRKEASALYQGCANLANDVTCLQNLQIRLFYRQENTNPSTISRAAFSPKSLLN
jgi:hypothetical protein